MLSAGSEVRGSTIAVNECQGSPAYLSRVSGSVLVSWSRGAAPANGATPPTNAAAAIPATRVRKSLIRVSYLSCEPPLLDPGRRDAVHEMPLQRKEHEQNR